MHNQAMTSFRPRHKAGARQQGTVTLLVLVALLVLFIGAMFSFRADLIDSGLTDHFAQRQQGIINSDAALQWMSDAIVTAANGRPLEVASNVPKWYLSAPLSGAPTDTYWTTCESANSGCAQVPSSVLAPGMTAWAFVHPTGRTDAYGCTTSGTTAVYYDVWLNMKNARTKTSESVEAVYKLCVNG